MKGINEVSSYTEEQAIYFTIENGYNGSEFETAAWKQRKCLKPDRTLKGLISKLETIFDYVEVTGTGKKRKYILKDKKVHITERQYNYKGSVPTPEDETMTEYIFNKLLTYPKGFNKSFRGWAKCIGFIEPDQLHIEDMIKEIKQTHVNFPVIYNPKEAVSVFLQTLSTRNKDIIEKSFQRLEKDNRIQVTVIYNIKHTDGTYSTIRQLEYEEILSHITTLLESNGVSYYAYSQALTSIHKSENMKLIIKEVAEYLEHYFGIDYLFKSFSISITDKTIKRDVAFDEFNSAYCQRLIKLTLDRQEKKEYKDSIVFWKRFYLLNTFVLLRFINATKTDELIKEQKRLYIEQVDEYHTDQMINNFESDIDKEINRITFGNN
jgi:hypothetical protein